MDLSLETRVNTTPSPSSRRTITKNSCNGVPKLEGNILEVSKRLTYFRQTGPALCINSAVDALTPARERVPKLTNSRLASKQSISSSKSTAPSSPLSRTRPSSQIHPSTTDFSSPQTAPPTAASPPSACAALTPNPLSRDEQWCFRLRRPHFEDAKSPASSEGNEWAQRAEMGQAVEYGRLIAAEPPVF